MSFRTWLGDEPVDWADYNFSEYPSMEALCNAALCFGPRKAFSPTRERMDEFLRVFEREHDVTFDGFWALKIGPAMGPWEDYTNTPTAKSIEMDEVVHGFIEAINKQGGL